MKTYDKTPSFYNNEEVFNSFLKSTSYYKGIQECLLNVIRFTNANEIVELGSATGASTFLIAENFPSKNITGYDFRQNIIDEAKKLNKFENVNFITMDMVEYAKNKIKADLVFMLYSFHHIIDPLQNKIDFLTNLHKNMKRKSYVCILETFIPENINLDDKNKILKLWEMRSNEGYSSTFWSVLKGKDLTTKNIKLAEEIASFSKKNEFEAGKLVAKRNNEYLVHKSWIEEQAKKIGFKVILTKPINAMGEGVVLLQK